MSGDSVRERKELGERARRRERGLRPGGASRGPWLGLEFYLDPWGGTEVLK